MLETLRNAFAVPDLRKKIFYTLMIIAIFRIGSAAIPVPFLLQEAIRALGQDSGTVSGYLDLFTGGGFSRATILALSISPYITASIVMQLLTIAIPALERMQKEGESGRKKIGQITRYATVILGLIEGTAYYLYLRNVTVGEYTTAVQYTTGFDAIFAAVVMVSVYTGGSALMMWLGEQINIKGIGNGISILLFAGIVARFDTIVKTLVAFWNAAGQDTSYSYYYFVIPILVVALAGMIFGVVYMSDAERRIPVQYAKRVVGRKMYGGQSSNIPIKVTMSGVMPIIFASALVSIPSTIYEFLNNKTGMLGKILAFFSSGSAVYSILLVILIIAFSYFYISISYNPIEMANNLRKNSGTIPGIRPGKPTSDYITRIVSRITLIGAIFLAIIAVFPTVIGAVSGINLALGGTTLLIVVGVVLDTSRQLESQMLMRHYKGFLE